LDRVTVHKLFRSLLAISAFIPQEALDVEWPLVAASHQRFHISESQPAVRTTVYGVDGRPLYLFVCRNADDPEAQQLNVIYAGDLDCRLIEAHLGEVETNLLIETPNVAAWYSRGRMFAEELYGDCARYPEYGRHRMFRLRGMRLSLQFEDVHFTDGPAPVGRRAPQLLSYTLVITVASDPTALSPIAAPSGYLDPQRVVNGQRRGCGVVQTGTEWSR
jgi:hypothetical protein